MMLFLMSLALIVIALAAFFVLALREAPLWHWGVAGLAIGFGCWLICPGLGLFWGVPGAVLLVLAIPVIRRLLVTGPIQARVKTMLPRVSRTEQEALDAGTVGWDAELFSGRPRWDRLMGVRKLTLTAQEQAFIDGPTEQLCAMIDDWDTRNNRADLAPNVWEFLKKEGFLGMLIGTEYGGLGFGAQAQSMIVSKIASRSVAAGITVMVPNSLGPGELLEKYGTSAQKDLYLRRLARGEEMPCFALTGPDAGSDAAGMRDIGVVMRGMFEGRETLGVRLSWDKRYITLAPVATLLGLAFHLHDPDNLLGKGEQVGITLALVPAHLEGVVIGRRHFPARASFMNGPTSGTDVFIPIDFLIGGAEYAGQGWRMLMECLATGRAISLPAIGTVSIKQALRVSSAYARIRRQFGIPIGIMEGVAEPLGRLVKSAYMFEAARTLTAAMVDEGQRPSVLSGLLKYRTTEAMRQGVDDAMDIHGGRGIQDGPSNYLFSAYSATPVAITVEGANILTRTLISFAQGALRAHPYLYREIAAVQMPDRAKSVAAFDAAFSGHAKFMARNVVASFGHGLTGGAFASSPVRHDMAHWYRQLHRYAQSFALVGDWMVVTLGGDLKRKQALSGRMADILSDLYLISAILKRYEDDGLIAEDRPVAEAAIQDCIHALETSFGAVFANVPNRVLGNLMRVLTFPLGRHAKPASDKTNYRLARAVLRPGGLRDRLTRGTYISFDPADPTGVLEDGLLKVTAAEAVEAKFVRAIKQQVITRRLDRDAIADARAAGVISAEDAVVLTAADRATDAVIRVDDFAPDALAARQLSQQ